MGTVADDLVANIQAGHELFVAQLPADENSPSARKLAALIAATEYAIEHLPQTYAQEIAKDHRPHLIRRRLMAAIAEARQ